MTFGIRVKSKSPSVVSGKYEATADDDHLLLTTKSGEGVEIPVGTPARHRKGDVFEFKLDDGIVECKVEKLGVYQQRLARDAALFLGGKRPAPQLQQYRLPWYFWVTSALPLGIPVLTLGGAIPALVGVTAGMICYSVAQLEDLPVWGRILISLTIAGLAYVLFFVFFVLAVLMGAGQPN